MSSAIEAELERRGVPSTISSDDLLGDVVVVAIIVPEFSAETLKTINSTQNQSIPEKENEMIMNWISRKGTTSNNGNGLILV